MFRVDFETCNAAFGETPEEHRAEVLNVLRLIGANIRKGGELGVVMDANGNSIGGWSLNRGCRCEAGEGK